MRWRLRDAMQWAHIWSGVAMGLLLMVAFLMGSIAVFDRELDRWMMPDTRLPALAEPVSLDRVVLRLVQQAAPANGQVLQWLADLPDARDPSLALAIDGRSDACCAWPTRTPALIFPIPVRWAPRASSIRCTTTCTCGPPTWAQGLSAWLAW